MGTYLFRVLIVEISIVERSTVLGPVETTVVTVETVGVGPQGPPNTDAGLMVYTDQTNETRAGRLELSDNDLHFITQQGSDPEVGRQVVFDEDLETGYQPLNSNLTSIAALTTTSIGRALLTESVSQTGSNGLVRATSPTLVTPNIGSATGSNLVLSSTLSVNGGYSALGLNGNGIGLAAVSSGIVTLYDYAFGAGFSRINLGGTTSSFPALKRVGTTLAVRLADDSADAPVTASQVYASNNDSYLGFGGINGNNFLGNTTFFRNYSGGAVGASINGVTGALTAGAITASGLNVTPASNGQSVMRLNQADGTRGVAIGSYVGSSGWQAVYFGSATPDSTNYSLLSTGGQSLLLNAANTGSIDLRFQNTTVFSQTNTLCAISTPVELRNGTTWSGPARINGSYTSPTVYHRLSLGHQVDSITYGIGTETNVGTYRLVFTQGGTARFGLDGSGNFIPWATNTYDVGGTSNRVRKFWGGDGDFSGAFTIGGAITANSINVGVAEFTNTAYFRTGQSFLNKAANNWLAFATRNTAGSEAVYDLTNVGAITASSTVSIAAPTGFVGDLINATLNGVNRFRIDEQGNIYGQNGYYSIVNSYVTAGRFAGSSGKVVLYDGGGFPALALASGANIFWETGTTIAGSRNVGFVKSGNGEIGINDGTNAGTTWKDLRLGNLTASGTVTSTGMIQTSSDIVFAPSSTITPTINGQVTIEKTSNTSLTFKLKGSDGVVRTGSITLS
jgi:hypothetical protein